MYRPTVGVFLAILLLFAAFLIAGLLSFLVQHGHTTNDGDGAAERGCIAGTFTATYERQPVEFRTQPVFLCGDGLLYRFTNKEGFPIYNDNPTKAAE